MKNRMKVLRAERNLSQAELADRLGVARQTINAMEAGKHDPSLRLAYAVAKALGATVQEVFPEE
jgi:putative transcriptional regulator